MVCKKEGCTKPVTHVGMTYCSRDCAPLGHMRERERAKPKKRKDWLDEWRESRRRAKATKVKRVPAP